MSKSLYIVLIVVLLAIAGAFIILKNPAHAPEETGSPTMSPSASVNPSSSVSPLPSATSQANIIITSPKANATVGNPITVTGKARTFEGAFSYVLRDTAGMVLFRGNGQAGAPDEVTFYRDFSVKIPVPVNAPRDLIIEVFEYSAKDGSIINLVRVPVRLASQATMTVQVYLNSRKLNANDSCDVVAPVTRTVLKTNEPAYIALYELLRGPVGAEKDQQYYTNIPDGVKINSIKIVNGTAYADFDAQLEYQVGGSCRVQAIRTQITNTLKQFSTIKNVVISVDGRVDDALQP